MKTIDELGISPTPWTVEDDGTTVVCPIDPEDDGAVSVVSDCDGVASDENNARLIAAAPELYEALREMVLVFSGVRPVTDEEAALSNAEAALAKAVGDGLSRT